MFASFPADQFGGSLEVLCSHLWGPSVFPLGLCSLAINWGSIGVQGGAGGGGGLFQIANKTYRNILFISCHAIQGDE